MERGEAILNAQLICNEPIGLVNGELCDLERVEIPGWLEKIDEIESCDDTSRG